MAFQIILLNPEIPPNAGNIIRLSANTGCRLHLVEPMGFELTDKQLRRAGLDYHEYADVLVHPNLSAAVRAAGDGRCFAVTAEGDKRYDSVSYEDNDIFLFGCESVGLAPEVRESYPKERRLFIPMRANSRSLNLSNAVAVIIMEAWRQRQFNGAVRRDDTVGGTPSRS